MVRFCAPFVVNGRFHPSPLGPGAQRRQLFVRVRPSTSFAPVGCPFVSTYVLLMSLFVTARHSLSPYYKLEPHLATEVKNICDIRTYATLLAM